MKEGESNNPSDLDKLAMASEAEVRVREGVEEKEKRSLAPEGESVPEQKGEDEGEEEDKRNEEEGVTHDGQDECGNREASEEEGNENVESSKWNGVAGR